MIRGTSASASFSTRHRPPDLAAIAHAASRLSRPLPRGARRSPPPAAARSAARELPPAAGPAPLAAARRAPAPAAWSRPTAPVTRPAAGRRRCVDRGRTLAVLAGARAGARGLRRRDAEAPRPRAGRQPGRRTSSPASGGLVYVTDTAGDGAARVRDRGRASRSCAATRCSARPTAIASTSARPPVGHADRPQPARRADRRRRPAPPRTSTRPSASRTRSRSTRRPAACSCTGDGVFRSSTPAAAGRAAPEPANSAALTSSQRAGVALVRRAR